MITLKEVAKAAGVNPSTVSRALSGDKRVKEKTRKMVEKLAAELNYTPNFMAKALSGKRTHLVGLIVPEISSNYYAQIIEFIETALKGKGYSLIIGTTGWNADRGMKNVDLFIGRKVDGIIYADQLSPEMGNIFRQEKKYSDFPVVTIGSADRSHDVEIVTVDEGYGISLLVNHLVSLGHQTFGFIGEHLSSGIRLPLFIRALAQAGLSFHPNHIKSGKERFEAGGYLRMKELLAEDDRPTAVLASYDYLAIGAMKAAHEAGLQVPEHISIVGFDNVRESEYLLTPLTTVYPPIKDMTQRAIDILIEKIEQDSTRLRPPATTTVYPQLVIRQSSSAPAPATFTSSPRHS
ncbi:LacI family DNA-binding transcriptional regulator [Paenibacillus nasutitermitis]|uniref:LacI family transcriptional regulator n=1 Tax=Paenibacillus nasutitermitis TaxID=1652958 RepID=A0A916YJD1_9BACL|nr:LacI family DNA-binding transcriptional regulator [Paenibacillus nasutitermitis]GGD47492.1 LacI family transcriptional regulator [Paenibacillus nasutitermitis]